MYTPGCVDISSSTPACPFERAVYSGVAAVQRVCGVGVQPHEPIWRRLVFLQRRRRRPLRRPRRRPSRVGLLSELPQRLGARRPPLAASSQREEPREPRTTAGSCCACWSRWWLKSSWSIASAVFRRARPGRRRAVPWVHNRPVRSILRGCVPVVCGMHVRTANDISVRVWLMLVKLFVVYTNPGPSKPKKRGACALILPDD